MTRKHLLNYGRSIDEEDRTKDRPWRGANWATGIAKVRADGNFLQFTEGLKATHQVVWALGRSLLTGWQTGRQAGWQVKIPMFYGIMEFIRWYGKRYLATFNEVLALLVL